MLVCALSLASELAVPFPHICLEMTAVLAYFSSKPNDPSVTEVNRLRSAETDF